MRNDEGGGLYRLSRDERLLILNYRLCTAQRQEVILDFSAALLKPPQPSQAVAAPSSSNVIPLTSRTLR
jgi:hypothetical protein